MKYRVLIQIQQLTQREFQNKFRDRSFLSRSDHPEFSSEKQIKASTINCFAENWHEQYGVICGKRNLFGFLSYPFFQIKDVISQVQHRKIQESRKKTR